MKYGFAGGLLWACDAVILDHILHSGMFAEMNGFRRALLAAGLHDTLSAAGFFIILILTGKWKEQKLINQEITAQFNLISALMGVVGGSIGMSCYLTSINSTGAGYAASVSAAYPAVGAVMAAVSGRETLKRTQLAGLLINVTGAVLISRMPEQYSLQTAGLVFALLSAFCWGLEGVLCSEGLKNTVHGFEIRLFFRQLASSAAYLLLLFPAFGIWRDLIKMPSLKLLLFTGTAAFMGTASYLCYYKAIEQTGPSRAMAANVSYTAWAVLLESVFNRTVPNIRMVLYTMMIFTGASLVSHHQLAGGLRERLRDLKSRICASLSRKE